MSTGRFTLHVHDPGHVALRRGVRAAIATPLTCVLALWLLPGSPGGLIAAFGSLCLVGICDFGGSTGRRLQSLIGAGVVGAVVITIGVLASQNVVSAVIVTFIVGAALAYSSVLRGTVASGAPAMTIMYVVAITAGVRASELVPTLTGWALALVVAIPITLFVLPRRDLGAVRQACTQAVTAFAEAVEARGRGAAPAAAALEAARDALHRSYLGNPFRAAGLSHRDRALVTLAGQMQGLLSSVLHGRAYPTPLPDEGMTRVLNHESAQVLRTAAAALRDPASPAPSGQALDEAWRAQWDAAVAIIAASTPGDAPARVDSVATLFPDRAMAVASVRVAMLVRRVLGLPDEAHATGPHTPVIPAPPVPSGIEDVRAQATLRSPWMRVALRTGLGLAIAVYVVSLTGIAHGLWVVLGVVSVLRFDGLTTLRTAGFALLGTFGGAAVGYLILAADSTQIAWMVVALAASTYLAMWVPAAVGFALGQAAFSIFVILAYTLMTWPPDLATATDRIEDVAIGAVVSILVALLLWPGGVLSGLIANVADAVRASSALMRDAVTSMVVGGSVSTSRVTQTNRAMARSEEVVEVSISSTAGKAAPYAFAWQRVIDHLRNPTVAARLLAEWSGTRTPIAAIVPGLEEPLMGELDDVLREWEGIAAEIDGNAPRPSVRDHGTLGDIARVASSSATSDPAVADAIVAATWSHGWLRMSLEAGRAVEVPAPV